MITVPVTRAHLHGVTEVEATPRGIRPHRLPEWVRQTYADQQLLMVEVQPSGVRIVVLTIARSIAPFTHPSRIAYFGVDRPRGHVDLVVDGSPLASDTLDGGDVTEVNL